MNLSTQGLTLTELDTGIKDAAQWLELKLLAEHINQKGFLLQGLCLRYAARCINSLVFVPLAPPMYSCIVHRFYIGKSH